MKRFVELDGDVFAGYDVAGDGPPVLLLHGLQGGRAALALLAALVSEDFTVYNVDQRDSGDTRNPATPYDLADLADDAASFITTLGLGRVHVFGTSFGSRIAQALALRHPELVDRLVLGAAWPLPQSIIDANPDGLARFMDIRGRLPASADELARFFVPAVFLDDHPDVRAALLALPDPPDRAARRTAAAATSWGDATSITAPTLLLAGDCDEMVPCAVTVGMVALIAGSQVEVLTGVGHAATLQAPEGVASAIRRFVA